MALRWVYDNIAIFNGNPDSITLFGPGAGAASAGLLMVAPRYLKLFIYVYIYFVNIYENYIFFYFVELDIWYQK